jgi:hypothetical protein
MKKQIDKKLILITGISAIFLVLGILTVTVYYGLKGNLPFLTVLKVILFETDIHMGFFLLNSVLVAIVCLALQSRMLAINFHIPVVVLSLVMLVINLTLVLNIMAWISALFWLLLLIFQYQNRKSVKPDESIQKA